MSFSRWYTAAPLSTPRKEHRKKKRNDRYKRFSMVALPAAVLIPMISTSAVADEVDDDLSQTVESSSESSLFSGAERGSDASDNVFTTDDGESRFSDLQSFITDRDFEMIELQELVNRDTLEFRGYDPISLVGPAFLDFMGGNEVQFTPEEFQFEVDGIWDFESGGSEELPGDLSLMHPVPFENISSPFGWRDNPTASGRQFHTGLDYPVDCGTPVRATEDGVVTFAEWDEKGGWRMMIDHGDGVETAYSHNTAFVVEVGDEVKKGDVIALSGTTGNSTGCHVHFEIILDGEWVDPALYLPGFEEQPEVLTDEEVRDLDAYIPDRDFSISERFHDELHENLAPYYSDYVDSEYYENSGASGDDTEGYAGDGSGDGDSGSGSGSGEGSGSGSGEGSSGGSGSGSSNSGSGSSSGSGSGNSGSGGSSDGSGSSNSGSSNSGSSNSGSGSSGSNSGNSGSGSGSGNSTPSPSPSPSASGGSSSGSSEGSSGNSGSGNSGSSSSTPSPAPSTPAPSPSSPAPSPAPSPSAPAPSSPAPSPSAPAPSSPAPSPSAPAPSSPAPSQSAPAPSSPAPSPSAPTPSSPAPEASAPAPSSSAPAPSAPAEPAPSSSGEGESSSEG